jgi:hypothetical protein
VSDRRGFNPQTQLPASGFIGRSPEKQDFFRPMSTLFRPLRDD